MKLSDLKQNLEAETDGVWIEYSKGLKLLIARHNNPNYVTMLRKLGKPLQAKHKRGGKLEDDLDGLLEVTQKAAARTLLLGWKGLTDDDGKEIVYSWKESEKILTDPACKDFFTDVVELSQDKQYFDEQEIEDAEGNSEAS